LLLRLWHPARLLPPLLLLLLLLRLVSRRRLLLLLGFTKRRQIRLCNYQLRNTVSWCRSLPAS
jgi:hypothetical protein